MKEKRLLNELGNVNDEFIEQAKPKTKRNHRKLYTAIGSVVTAAAVFAFVFTISNNFLGKTTVTDTDSSNAITKIQTSDTAVEKVPLTFDEIEMPSLDYYSSIDFDLYNFFGIGCERLECIIPEIEQLIKDSCSAEVSQEFEQWIEDYNNQRDKKIAPVNITDSPNLPNIVNKYSLDHDKIVKILNDTNNFSKQNLDHSPLFYSLYIYTDEEIEAIASGNVQKCYDLFTFDKAIRKGDYIYPPAYIYTASMDEIEAAGITAQELADRAFAYTSFCLSGKHLTALQNKLLTYIAKSAQNGKFSGSYTIPYEATFSVPKHIGNAEFIEENVSDINAVNNPQRSAVETDSLIGMLDENCGDGFTFYPMKHPEDPKALFDAWKKLNNIGNDVKLIKCSITDNSKEEITESIATYTPATMRIVEITVSKTIENYYGDTEELLLDSLEKTFSSCFDFCDDYKLIIE